MAELADWPQRRDRYRRRLAAVLDPLAAAIDAGDPVPAFLFDYYGLRPGRLRCWHPGYGATLPGPAALAEYGHRRGYTATGAGVRVGADFLATRVSTVRFVAGLLRATAARPAQLNCFGMHEWAMLYRSTEVRHAQVPLRLSPAEVDAVVEATPLRCTHFDAFRFFTTAAVPRNATELTRTGQTASEQPGCLHANMDLFKWALKLSPLIDSELLLDGLRLAATARELDMRASPYDLSDYGYRPIAVERPAGRAEYVRRQTEVAERARPLRAALLEQCDLLLRVEE